jgi:transcriptional regulator with XRE-family HTH domain
MSELAFFKSQKTLSGSEIMQRMREQRPRCAERVRVTCSIFPSLAAAAAAASVSRATLRKWMLAREAGGSWPRFEELARLAIAADVNLFWLLGEHGEAEFSSTESPALAVDLIVGGVIASLQTPCSPIDRHRAIAAAADALNLCAVRLGRDPQ